MSYSESFEPSTGSYWDGSPFVPTTGRQFEAGVKFQPEGSDTLVTLAAYHMKQQNVSTPDPEQVNHPGGQVQTGEIRSKGIEREAQSDITRNLRIWGAFTLIDAEVTKSNIAAQIGLVPVDTPSTMASLWADYTVREGELSGLSFGLGGRYMSGAYDITTASGRMAAPCSMRWSPTKSIIGAWQSMPPTSSTRPISTAAIRPAGMGARDRST